MEKKIQLSILILLLICSYLLLIPTTDAGIIISGVKYGIKNSTEFFKWEVINTSTHFGKLSKLFFWSLLKVFPLNYNLVRVTTIILILLSLSVLFYKEKFINSHQLIVLIYIFGVNIHEFHSLRPEVWLFIISCTILRFVYKYSINKKIINLLLSIILLPIAISFHHTGGFLFLFMLSILLYYRKVNLTNQEFKLLLIFLFLSGVIGGGIVIYPSLNSFRRMINIIGGDSNHNGGILLEWTRYYNFFIGNPLNIIFLISLIYTSAKFLFIKKAKHIITEKHKISLIYSICLVIFLVFFGGAKWTYYLALMYVPLSISLSYFFNIKYHNKKILLIIFIIISAIIYMNFGIVIPKNEIPEFGLQLLQLIGIFLLILVIISIKFEYRHKLIFSLILVTLCFTITSNYNKYKSYENFHSIYKEKFSGRTIVSHSIFNFLGKDVNVISKYNYYDKFYKAKDPKLYMDRLKNADYIIYDLNWAAKNNTNTHKIENIINSEFSKMDVINNFPLESTFVDLVIYKQNN